MPAHKKYHTEEERRTALKEYRDKWRSNPDNAKKQYLSNQKTQAERFKKWRLKNKDKQNAKSNMEKAAKLQRIPLWADLEAIKQFYLNCPKGYHVDHIIPLRGKTVSGLHILENLQYLLAKENLSKGNKF
jgi:5-methylcytosine-specific restriction endonuclease McrA